MLAVSYFPDKSDKEIIKALTIRDGRVYADDQPMPKFGQADPDFKGKTNGCLSLNRLSRGSGGALGLDAPKPPRGCPWSLALGDRGAANLNWQQ